MSSPEVHEQISNLIRDGQRTIVLNLEEVNYVSSAGLRVFLGRQKQLKKVGGEIVVYAIPDPVMDIFKTSGFDRLFRLAHKDEKIDSLVHPDGAPGAVMTKEFNGISLKYVQKEANAGSLRVIGSQSGLPLSEYTEADVVFVKAGDIQFGAGLATLGENFLEYRNLFGESAIVNGNLFYYPAVKRPAVDFMLRSQQESDLTYNFLHGFGVTGSYKYIFSFESTDALVELQPLVESIFEISDSNILGIVLVAESKGFFGMNLKNVPLIENQPKNGKDIFDPANFSEWINFPVEPVDINNIIVCTGIAIKDKSNVPPKIKGLLPKGNRFHMHGGVFSKGPLSKNIEHFEDEIERVLTELEVYRIQHVLGRTRFSNGMAGIIELEG